MSNPQLSTMHAWLLAASVLGLFLCGVAGLTGAGTNKDAWFGVLYLLVAVIAFAGLAKLLLPR